MVQLVRHIDIILFHVGHHAVLLTACGSGTLGIRAGVAAYRNNRDRCTFFDTPDVEERRVQGFRREAAILEGKLTSFIPVFVIEVPLKFSF